MIMMHDDYYLICALSYLGIKRYCLSRAWWETFKSCIKRSGPCSIKFAQWISTRPDLIPIRCCRQLSDLQTRASLHSWAESQRALEEHFGEGAAERLGLSADSVVLGSGCVAQVLLGSLDGRKVAVKILHPGVAESIAADLTVMRFVASCMEAMVPGLDNWSLVESVDEFSHAMWNQLDLQQEAARLERFTRNFSSDASSSSSSSSSSASSGSVSSSSSSSSFRWHRGGMCVRFPVPQRPFVARSVLVESFEDGTPLGELLNGDAGPVTAETRQRLANLGLDAVLKMVFEDNFIHGDMHPGNIIVRTSSSSSSSSSTSSSSSSSEVSSSASSSSSSSSSALSRFNFLSGLALNNQDEAVEMILVDAGIVAELNSNDKKNLSDLFKAVVRNYGDEAGRLLIERSRHHRVCLNADQFCEDMRQLVQDVNAKGLQLKNISISSIIEKLLMLCRKHNVKLESRFVQVIVSLGIVEGLGRRLDPDVDILKRAAPFILKAAINEGARSLSNCNDGDSGDGDGDGNGNGYVEVV